MKKIWIIPIIIAVVGVFYVILSRKPGVPASSTITLSSPQSLPGLLTNSFPWTANTDQLKNRLSFIHLPSLSTEGDVLHTHQHLDISVNGGVVPIPANIGVPSDNSFISPLHTHDTSAIIHVESPVIQEFTLGQFFDIWGVNFTDNCLGGYCQDITHILRLYTNGQLVSTNFRHVPLTAHQEIFIYYGPADKLPSSIPSTYQFPPDY